MVKTIEERRAYRKEWYAKNKERVRAKNREWYLANREKAIAASVANARANPEATYARQRRWKAAHPEQTKRLNRNNWLKRVYGLTRQQYDEMFEAQGRVCACCGGDTPGGHADWHVDHDHKTGVVRGILCRLCNLLLGHARDDSTILLAGVRYLTRT